MYHQLDRLKFQQFMTDNINGGEKCEIHNPTNCKDVWNEPTGDEVRHPGTQNRAGGN